jgi:ferritin-like metal-binding protein YciE
MDVIEILHSLMKKQRMNHESRVSRIGKLRKSFGSDESLWLAEVGRQQAIVDALGDQARRPRDDEMPRRFRQHALEYIKELVGVEAAMSILEDISEGKQKRSIDLSKKLFDGVILKHECFRPLQKSRKLFIDWRDSAERNNRSLIMNFIRENGTHEQKARLEAILLATSKRKRKRQQCSTLVDLAYAASQLRQEDGSTSGVEDGVTVGAEGGGGGLSGNGNVDAKGDDDQLVLDELGADESEWRVANPDAFIPPPSIVNSSCDATLLDDTTIPSKGYCKAPSPLTRFA